MAFDGIVTNCIVWELSGILTGGRISRVFQPEKDEAVLLVRKNADNYRVLLSANPQYARIGLTSVTKENPMVAPGFCMALRKHLIGAEIKEVTQDECDRIVRIRMETYNEMGDLTEKTLVTEIMGRNSNVILLNEKGVILEAIRHVDERISSYREVLPARVYVSPPPQNKLLPQDRETGKAFLNKMKLPEFSGEKIGKLLLDSLSGFSKPVCAAICRNGGIDPETPAGELAEDRFRTEALAEELESVLSAIRDNRWSPFIQVEGDGTYRDFHVLNSLAAGEYRKFSTAEACIDEFYRGRDAALRCKNAKSDLTKAVSNAIDHAEKKLKIYGADLEEAKDYEEIRVLGELLQANLYRLKGGEDALDCVNYYEEACPTVSVPLNPHVSPAKNLAAYFRQYRKKKSKTENAEKNREETEKELEYLESVRYLLDSCTENQDIAQIKEELESGGYLKKKAVTGGKRPPAVKKEGYLTVTVADGYTCWVGKNNVQNDRITTVLAAPDDVWFHVKKATGSHVILRASERNGAVTEAALTEAARLAMDHSSAAESSVCEVDFTRAKYVKKPSGAKPGMVIYRNEKTIVVKKNA